MPVTLSEEPALRDRPSAVAELEVPLLKSIKGDARHLAQQIAFDETLPTSWPAADEWQRSRAKK